MVTMSMRMVMDGEYGDDTGDGDDNDDDEDYG